MSDDEIFKKYVLLRVTEDSKIVFSDFPSTASPSLNYLSEESGVSLIKANDGHWVKDDDPVQPEMSFVEDITPAELEEKRKKNIENITQKFSSSLALRIRQFETYTKDFYDMEKRGLKQATKFFEKALELLPENSDDKEITLTRNVLQRRIDENKKALQPYMDPFHQTLRAAYREPDLLKKIDLLKNLYYKGVDKRDLGDFHKFNSSKNPVSVNRFRTELKCDLAKQIQSCYKNYGGRQSDVMYWQQEIDAHNTVLKDYKTKLLGQKGAFSKGGIYGPDSLLLWAENADKQQPQKEKYIPPKTLIEGEQLKLFTDKDFEY